MPLKPERNEEVYRLRRRGMPIKEIARRYQISPERVRQIFIRGVSKHKSRLWQERKEYAPPSYDDIRGVVDFITKKEGWTPTYDVDEVTAAIVTNLTGKWHAPRQPQPTLKELFEQRKERLADAKRAGDASVQRSIEHIRENLARSVWEPPPPGRIRTVSFNPLDGSLPPIFLEPGEVCFDSRAGRLVIHKAPKDAS